MLQATKVFVSFCRSAWGLKIRGTENAPLATRGVRLRRICICHTFTLLYLPWVYCQSNKLNYYSNNNDEMSWGKEECLIYLTLGDGDFTFSLDLAGWLSHATKNESNPRRRTLICTGLDSFPSLTHKYRDTPFLLKQLTKYNSDRFSVIVGHEVNAIAAPKEDIMLSQLPAHIVIFNHPHLATENAKLHGHFLHHLFDSVSHTYMAVGGIFLLTLAQGQYERWDCEKAAAKQGMKFLWRGVFHPPPLRNDTANVSRTYYSLRRHQTGKSFANRVLGASETLVFHRTEETIDLQWKTYVEWLFLSATESDDTTQRTEQPLDSHPCPHCAKVFSEQRSLKNHMQSKHAKRKRETAFTCATCSREGVTRVFDSAQGLEDHMNVKHRAVHTSIRPDWCQISDETSPAEKLVAPLQCPICEARLFGSDPDQALKMHMESFLPQNEDQLSFACSFCDKVFPQDRARLQHENYCARKRS